MIVEPSLEDVAAFMRCERINDCRVCGGWGWKFVNFRRSVTNAGDAGEQASLHRSRVTCTACGGRPSGGDESGTDD